MANNNPDLFKEGLLQFKNLDDTAIEINGGSFGDLSSLIGSVDWKENPLKDYQTYTYNLKLFAVDYDSVYEFLSGRVGIKEIHGNEWPKSNTVVIAQTGTTGELHIDNLNIRSIGNPNTLRSGGTSTNLSFTITGVGNTYVIDKILDTVAVLGYPSIANAIFFMEVTFNGYVDNVPVKLDDRRIFPFAISKYRDINTETSVSGTVATFDGVIISDTASRPEHDMLSINTEFNFTDNALGTIEEFIKVLNNKVAEQSFTDDTNFINTYHIEFSDTFKNLYGSNNPITDSALVNMAMASSRTRDQLATGGAATGVGARIGILHANTSIQETIKEIILKSKKVSDHLTATSDHFTNVPYLKVNAIPKKNGLNYLTGEHGHEIHYFVDVRKELVDQNVSDTIAKAQNANAILEELMRGGRLAKIYHSDYTGLNTDIIQFDVSLNQQLTKTYNTRTNEYALDNFVTDMSNGLNNVNERGRDRMKQLLTDAENLSASIDQAKDTLQLASDALQLQNQTMRNAYLDTISGVVGSGNPEVMAVFREKSLGDLYAFSQQSDDPVAQAMRDMNMEDQFKVYDDQRALVNRLSNDVNARTAERAENIAQQASLVDQVNGRYASSRVYADIQQGLGKLDLEPVTLSEDLSDNIRFNLTSDASRTILATLMTNPGIFKDVSYNYVSEQNKLRAQASNHRNNEDLVRAKYDEATNLDMSMINASMTIVGDPFWLEHFISPVKLKEEFNESNILPDQSKNVTTSLNGFNTVMIVRNAVNGTGEGGNIRINNLFTYVYFVRDIESNFSNGVFTQTLDMIRLEAANNYGKSTGSTNGTVDPEDEQYDDEVLRSLRAGDRNFGAQTFPAGQFSGFGFDAQGQDFEAQEQANINSVQNMDINGSNRFR